MNCIASASTEPFFSIPQEYTQKTLELTAPPESYDSVKGVKSTEEVESFFKVELRACTSITYVELSFILLCFRLMSVWCTMPTNNA